MSQLSGAQDSSRVLQHLFTGQRVATPAMGDAPLEGTVVSATATECVVTINGFSTEATFTAKYTTQWVAGAVQIPAAGTTCLVAFPPNSPTRGPWVVAFFGQGAPAGSVPTTIGTSAGAPTTGAWVAGQEWLDTNGVLWVCTAGGTPGTWAPIGVAGNPAGFIYATAQTVIATSVATQITSMAVGALSGGMTFASNGLQVPVAGNYMIEGATVWQNSGGGVAAAMYEAVVFQNGIQQMILGGCQMSVTAYAHCSGGGMLHCSAGDLLTLGGYQNSGAPQGTFGDLNHTHLAVALASR